MRQINIRPDCGTVASVVTSHDPPEEPPCRFTASTTVAEIAARRARHHQGVSAPQIDFCCGGKIPLADACARHGLDTDALLAELRAARAAADDPADWRRLPLKDLVAHIQARYHGPLRDELPRLGAMLDKVVRRHGHRLPETLLPLQTTFESLRRELLEHMAKEDAVLFPVACSPLEANAAAEGTSTDWTWIEQPIDVMEAEHEAAGAALARMRALTDGYAPPEDACPTFRGLYLRAVRARARHAPARAPREPDPVSRAARLASARSVERGPAAPMGVDVRRLRPAMAQPTTTSGSDARALALATMSFSLSFAAWGLVGGLAPVFTDLYA